MTRTGRNIRIPGLAALTALALVAGCTGTPNNRANVEIRGTDPQTGVPKATPQGQTPAQAQTPARRGAGGVIDYGDYQAAVAQQGDTVASVAARIGVSASELGAYNGLQPTHPLRAGDELVLPRRPAGTQVAEAPAPVEIAPATPARPSIEAQPLDAVDPNQPVQPADAIPADAVIPNAVDAPTPTAPADANAPQQKPSEWSPDIAAAAIERSTGLQDDGTLGAPPSANAPVPPEPTKRRNLESPDLGQYQTNASEQPQPAEPAQNVATAGPEPKATAPKVRLQRPVKGPVAIGFNKGNGPARNDGVDFAAPAGAPVVAAADGEVALVSQSLGGLGTIVLVRHEDELLTVYGRIDDVGVQKGDLIRRGQKIGVVSDAAAPAEPRMHFEVRRGAESLDPMQFL